MIYLEEKVGFIRNYSVTIIIDLSKLFFNQLSFKYIIWIIRIILCSLATNDLPSFDLIIDFETNPYIFYSDIGTFRELNKNLNYGNLY